MSEYTPWISSRFWALFETSSAAFKAHIVDFARFKLLNSQHYNPFASDLQRSLADLAVLDTRLLLPFAPDTADVKRIHQAHVRSHMRVLHSVSSDRRSIYAGYPSEPILAEAAAHVMEEWGRTKTINALASQVTNGLIVKDKRGRLVARLLLIFSIDHAQLLRANRPPRVDVRDIYFSNTVPVGLFLQALLGQDHWQRVRAARPSNMPGAPLEDVFKDAKVRFTHFVQAGDSMPATSVFAYSALIRGMAIQFGDQKDAIDILIPIFMDSPTSDRKVCEAETTAILVSVANRSEQLARAKALGDEEAMSFFPPGSAASKPRPFITIQMELGVRKKGEGGASGIFGSTTASARPTDIEQMEVDPSHPRYSLYIYGCSPAVYGVIDDSDKDKYIDLLSSHHPLDDLSRPESLDAVMALKSVFGGGTALSSWVLGEAEDDRQVVEGVEIAQFADSAGRQF